MDGVIANTAPFHFQSWQLFAREYGCTFTEMDFKQSFGKRNPEILIEKFDSDLSFEDIKRLAERKEEIFRDLIGEKAEMFPGVLDLMQSAEENGWKMALVSSTPPENIDLILQTLDIRNFFNVVISDGDVSQGKPDPEGFLLAAKKLDAIPPNCVVIEDAVAGVRAAKSGGMKCIAVTNTRSADKLSEADLVVDSLTNVAVETLEGLLK